LLNAQRELPPEDLPALLGQLEAAKATAWARLTAPTQAQPEHDQLIGVTDAASRLGVSTDYLYTHHSQYSFNEEQKREALAKTQQYLAATPAKRKSR
jgi:hypothetical protein